MGLTDFIMNNKWVLLAYLVLAIIVFVNRKKFLVENKVFLLYKTKWGVKFIDSFAEKNKGFVKLVGYCAIGIGFVGMIVIVGFFVKGLYDLVFVPNAPPTVSLVIPGVQIPGSPIKIPFGFGVLALFIVILIHEFGHGIVARAHGIKIKSTGIGLLGPIPLAFVEPDEKSLMKENSAVQNSVFAAGPFMNVILAIFMMILLAGIYPIMDSMTTNQGITFQEIQKGYAADKYGLQTGVVYDSINGMPINNRNDFLTELYCIKPNDKVVISSGASNTTVIVGGNPQDVTKPYLGVLGLDTKQELKNKNGFYTFIYGFLKFFTELFEWVYMLSLGIGLANLLPLGPVDGGRMLLISVIDIKGKEKGTKIWGMIAWFTLCTLIILLIVPIIKSIFFKV